MAKGKPLTAAMWNKKRQAGPEGGSEAYAELEVFTDGSGGDGSTTAGWGFVGVRNDAEVHAACIGRDEAEPQRELARERARGRHRHLERVAARVVDARLPAQQGGPRRAVGPPVHDRPLKGRAARRPRRP